MCDSKETIHLIKQLRHNKTLAEEDYHYMLPTMVDGRMQGAIMVSEGTLILVGEPTHECTPESKPQCEEAEDTPFHARVEELNDDETRDVVLVDEQCQPLVLVEGEGDTQGGSTDCGEKSDQTEQSKDTDLSFKDIVVSESRDNLVEAIKADESLATARKLADDLQEGYHWIEGLLFRTRLEAMGDTIEQLSLPIQYRLRCLTLSHDKFGHAGRNRMGQHIKRYFYWPSMTRDAAKHIKSCDTCQIMDKTLPKRLLVTVPSERVAVDIVGPFQVAKVGFKYLLMYLDMATRWPEAIPLRVD